ncbi:UDP-Glycosyltransferase superfamily protein [Euphorbia peplus]|nr:UDP-Glycosyltransferase superfamily protein [Euphorbia peplus]
MGKAELIFVANPSAGHLTSTMEFAKALIQHDHELFINVLVIKLPFTRYVDVYLKSLTNSQPNIRLIHIPQPEEANLPSFELIKKSIESYMIAFFDAHKPLVRDTVRDIILSRDSSGPIVGLVVDLFCPSMLDIGDEFGIPSFIYSISCTAFLNLMLHLSSRHEMSIPELSLSNPEMSIPGFVNPVPSRVFPQGVFNKYGGYDAFMQIGKGFKNCKGVVYNSFYELEPYGIESCKKENIKVYPIGPILNTNAHPNPETDRGEWDMIMKWLDDQAESSVVYLCFGSAGTFGVDQVKEIAQGLEHSGHKFLWSMRANSNLKEMLPEGFMKRIHGRGMVSIGWSPQAEILGHKAIGGFVCHNGWNSMVESIWFGVPIAALPLYAEQQLIAFTFVKELGLAVDLKFDYRGKGEIGRGEVEKGVRSLMDSENEVRKKLKNMSRIARSVGMEGGSSFNSLREFIREVRKLTNVYS